MNAYKYLYVDNQQINFRNILLTNKYYSSKRACERDWHRDTEAKIMFRILRPLKDTKQTGVIAEILTEHEIVVDCEVESDIEL